MIGSSMPRHGLTEHIRTTNIIFNSPAPWPTIFALLSRIVDDYLASVKV